MTEVEKLNALEALTGIHDRTLLGIYLKRAGDKVILRAYPFESEGKPVPAKYESIQLNVAEYLISKRGAEGETAHSANGVSRSYEDADVPASMLRDVLPMIGVI